jgi:hypothetical protein
MQWTDYLMHFECQRRTLSSRHPFSQDTVEDVLDAVDGELPVQCIVFREPQPPEEGWEEEEEDDDDQ